MSSKEMNITGFTRNRHRSIQLIVHQSTHLQNHSIRSILNSNQDWNHCLLIMNLHWSLILSSSQLTQTFRSSVGIGQVKEAKQMSTYVSSKVKSSSMRSNGDKRLTTWTQQREISLQPYKSFQRPLNCSIQTLLSIST